MFKSGQRVGFDAFFGNIDFLILSQQSSACATRDRMNFRGSLSPVRGAPAGTGAGCRVEVVTIDRTKCIGTARRLLIRTSAVLDEVADMNWSNNAQQQPRWGHSTMRFGRTKQRGDPVQEQMRNGHGAQADEGRTDQRVVPACPPEHEPRRQPDQEPVHLVCACMCLLPCLCLCGW